MKAHIGYSRVWQLGPDHSILQDPLQTPLIRSQITPERQWHSLAQLMPQVFSRQATGQKRRSIRRLLNTAAGHWARVLNGMAAAACRNKQPSVLHINHKMYELRDGEIHVHSHNIAVSAAYRLRPKSCIGSSSRGWLAAQLLNCISIRPSFGHVHSIDKRPLVFERWTLQRRCWVTLDLERCIP